MRYYTNSEMGTFKDCRRKWWLGTYRRLQRRHLKVTGAAPIGTRVHKALEAHYQPVQVMDPREALKIHIAGEREALIRSYDGPPNIYEHNPLESELKQFEDEAQLAVIMIDGYMQWLEESGEDSNYIVLSSEETVAFEFAPGYSLAGKRDTRLQRLSDGVKLSMDHKTGDFNGLMQQASQNEQMLLYEILQRITDPDNRNEGMLLNMLRKVKRTARANPPFYKRHEIRFNQPQLEAAWYHVMAVIGDIQSVTARLDAGESHQTVVYPRPNRDCSWKCEFFPVCPLFDDGSRAEDMIQSLFVQGDPLDRYPDLTGDHSE
jgi:hypothetical protein